MDKLIVDPLIGADIEVFVAERATNRIVSAEPYIKGTKDEPFVFDMDNPFFATSLDNVLAEFGIPPARTKKEFYDNIQRSLGYINSILPMEYCTAILPAANLEQEFLQTEQAKIFGCEPDFNAYTGVINFKPHCEDKTLRSCGGHLHFSWARPTDYVARTLVKALDLHLAVPSVLMEPENKRKELYGKAGAYRPKEYGCEYRTLSNYYLESKKLTDWVYTSAHAAIEWVNNGKALDTYMDDVVQDAINKNDKEIAATIIREFHLKIAV